ncbi:MAG TPA: hypothetical protein VG297_19340, partial [Bryobacteraceae bacterium]|nr:hypothetical protein [Bryobacteraceae bacterium]
RPLSDRGFFLLFENLFGFQALPFHIWVCLTLAADTLLLGWIAARITGSRVAGVVAPVLWVANSALAPVLSWSSAYNEALCPVFLLAALVLFIRFIETGRWIFWWWQLVVFTLGFGALEVNVVYPALAAAYALAIARLPVRRTIRILLPLFVISCVYFFVHRAAAALPSSGMYAVHLDARVFATLAKYWHSALIPKIWSGRGHRRELIVYWGLTAGLGAFLIRETAKARYLAIFAALWFLITLAPMLAIPDHVTDFYLTIPLMGLVMAGAWALVVIWREQKAMGIAAALAAVYWVSIMSQGSLQVSQWWLARTGEVRSMVLGVSAAHAAHPNKIIVLDGVTTDLFNNAVGASAFYPFGVDYVYLTPGSEDSIHPDVDADLLPMLALEPAVMKQAITHDDVVVYSVLSDHLRNITEAYERSALPRLSLDKSEPRRIDAGNPLFAYWLGPEWLRPESGTRWMPGRATVRLGGPGSAPGSGNVKLLLSGYCPEQLLESGPLHISVAVDGIPLRSAEISNPENTFRRLFDVPSSLAGKQSVEISIVVDRVLHDAGGRELGLVFGTIGFQQ